MINMMQILIFRCGSNIRLVNVKGLNICVEGSSTSTANNGLNQCQAGISSGISKVSSWRGG